MFCPPPPPPPRFFFLLCFPPPPPPPPPPPAGHSFGGAGGGPPPLPPSGERNRARRGPVRRRHHGTLWHPAPHGRRAINDCGHSRPHNPDAVGVAVAPALGSADRPRRRSDRLLALRPDRESLVRQTSRLGRRPAVRER